MDIEEAKKRARGLLVEGHRLIAEAKEELQNMDEASK